MIKINDTLYPSKDTTIKKTLLGVNVIETSVQAEVKIGDVLNDWYHVTQINSKKGDYTSVTAEHEIYKLINIVYQNTDNYFSQFSYANARLEELIGTESLLQSLIPYNIVINSDVNLDAKRDIEFQDDNCLSALQKIAERYSIEFIPKINGTSMEIFIANIIGNTIPQLNVVDGVNAANVNHSIDSTNLVTRVYPNGATAGLPINYAFNNLKPNKFYAYADPDLVTYPYHGRFDDPEGTFTGKIIVASDSQIPESDLSLSVSFNSGFTINTESTIVTVTSFPSNTNQLAKLKLMTIDDKLIKDIYISQVGQKIFFNDIKWVTSTPDFYIEDATLPMHPIEKSVTFSEIQPKLIHGQILNFQPSLNSTWTITVPSVLIERLDLSEIHKQKSRVSFYDYSTMFSGTGFIIQNIDYTNGILTVLPPKEEEIDKLRKNDNWLISTGDVSNKNFTFTIEDYIHVDQVNDACQAVLEQGEEYLKEHKNPQITYNIDRLKATGLEIGDTVKIVDGMNWLKIESFEITGDDNIDLSFTIDGIDTTLETGKTIEKLLKVTLTNNTSVLRDGFLELKINGETFLTYNYSINPAEYENIYGYVGTIVRIMEYSYNGSEYSNLVLQNFNRFKAYAYNQQEATMADIYNAKDAVKVNISEAARKAKFQEDQWQLLIDTNFYGDYTLTEGIRIGSEDRNFLISNLSFDEGENGDNFIWNKVSWTAFDFTMAINPNVTVSINAGSASGLTASNYFIYIKIQEGTEVITPDITVDPSSINNTIELRTTKRSSTYDSGYYYFAIGVVKLQTNASKLYALSYGMTYIDGGLIKAKTISATEITDVLLFTGHTIRGSIIESTQEEVSSTDPITMIDLDTPYFKIGDKTLNKYIEYKKDPVTGEYNFTLVGGQLEAVNALLWSDTDVNVTVGSTGDFLTLNDALEYMSKFMIIHNSNGSRLRGRITLKSGFQLKEQIFLYNQNLSWVIIDSEDNEVIVDSSVMTTQYSGKVSSFYIEDSIAPTFSVLFKLDSVTPADNKVGMYLVNSSVKFLTPNLHTQGFYNYNINIKTDFSQLKAPGIKISNGETIGGDFRNSTIEIDFADVENCHRGIYFVGGLGSLYNLWLTGCVEGMFATNNANIGISSSDFTNVASSQTGFDILCDNAKVEADDIIQSTSTLSEGIKVQNGGIISAHQLTNSNMSQKSNIITEEGIILSDTNIGMQNFISASRSDTSNISDTTVAESYMNTNYGSASVGTTAQLRQTWSGVTIAFYLIKLSVGWKSLYHVQE